MRMLDASRSSCSISSVALEILHTGEESCKSIGKIMEYAVQMHIILYTLKVSCIQRERNDSSNLFAGTLIESLEQLNIVSCVLQS